MSTKKKDELVNVRQAASECGRNMETIRRWIWGGKLPAQKLGNQLFIKKSDLASFCRLPARSLPAKVGETAVEYQAGSLKDFLKQAKALQEQMKARGVKPIDAAEEIRQMREERMNQIEQAVFGTKATKDKTKAGQGEDFLERAIAFRNKLRARGYPEVDTAALVRKSREGRMRELRQSLR